MSALSIQVPFPVFQDRDGQPLENGYVWVGVANLNPQTNPVVAYYDEALTIVAAQPLRTLNGYISRAGTPAQIYVNGVDYSILVQDSKGSMVYNFPEGTGVSSQAAGVAFTGFKGQLGNVQDLADDDGSDWIGFKPAGVGSVARSAQDKMRDTISVKDFGAVGDGVANDTVAINAAYAAAEAVGGSVVYWPAGTYRTTGTITCGAKCSTNAQQAILSYTGSSVALDIQGVWDTDAGVNKGNNISILPFVTRSSLGWNAGTDSTSIGVRIANRKMTTFFVRGIKFFYRGLVLESTTANTVCNTFQLGFILDNQYGIDFGTIATGWGTNQNQFIGGQIGVTSIYTAVSPRILVNMPDVGENNTNTFIGVNLEKSGNEKAIVCASPENLFLNCRFEGSASTAGYITISGNRNRIIGGAPSAATTLPFETWITDTGFGNQYWMGYILASKSFALDFSTVSNPLRFGNGTSFPTVPISGFGTDRLALGNSNTAGVRYNSYMMQEEIITISGTTIPQKQHQQLNYAAPATITGITSGFDRTIAGVFSLIDLNGNITLTHTASPADGAGKFVLTAGVNLVMSANTPVLFVACNGNLYQA